MSATGHKIPINDLAPSPGTRPVIEVVLGLRGNGDVHELAETLSETAGVRGVQVGEDIEEGE
ncbi:hypothetical protein [Salinactinospora qingdaonensis]|uniref:Uncharacterized protein n=1 Tax=Salinactinospora qingdaonensis TaxID=702744 RepID=A0ABP7FPS2_9ACTN